MGFKITLDNSALTNLKQNFYLYGKITKYFPLDSIVYEVIGPPMNIYSVLCRWNVDESPCNDWESEHNYIMGISLALGAHDCVHM